MGAALPKFECELSKGKLANRLFGLCWTVFVSLVSVFCVASILGPSAMTWFFSLVLLAFLLLRLLSFLEDWSLLGGSSMFGKLVLRVDENGCAINDKVVFNWDGFRTLEVERRRGRLSDSLIVFTTPEGKGKSTDLPFGAMTHDQADRCLETINHYTPR